jgi:gamma-tubulin complex component 4
MLAPSLKQFSLRVEILPSYIPVRVAEKILFVGESVQMFENQNVNLTRKGRNLLAQYATSGQVSFVFGGPKQAWSE